jgi:hypothetical protein
MPVREARSVPLRHPDLPPLDGSAQQKNLGAIERPGFLYKATDVNEMPGL